ncbi:hypothetical protein QBC36DRAFT_345707 [Triangularia setosa]|uniref:Uncharacterized protein n=1 Tax=Triangularia setosa TaxID=2587417 RepID=A0AAN6W859_9PEZI|nr:hypothetical protein QBC36DRAFT_345707 [Podospora setosa]
MDIAKILVFACDRKRSTCTDCLRRDAVCVYGRVENSALISQLSCLQHVVNELRLGDSVDQLAHTVASAAEASPSAISDTKMTMHPTAPKSALYSEENNDQLYKSAGPSSNPHGDFLAPAFDRSDLEHNSAELLTKGIDSSAGSAVVLRIDTETDGAAGASSTPGVKMMRIWSSAVGLQSGVALNALQPYQTNLQIHPSILSKHGKLSIQGNLLRSLFVLRWSMMIAHSNFDGRFTGALFRLSQRGTEDVFGAHASIGALFDRDEFEKAPLLSHEKHIQHDVLCIFYVLFWLIMPTKEHFVTVPTWLQPTPNQLLMPHLMILDYVVWPALREYVVSIPPCTIEEVLCRDEITGATDLTPIAKRIMNVARQLESWSLGPTFRSCVPNAESIASIRPA